MLENVFVTVVVALGALLGLAIFRQPELAMEIQRKFYAKINWRMEPIDRPKEIRNTKSMGLFLIVFSFLIGMYTFLKTFL